MEDQFCICCYKKLKELHQDGERLPEECCWSSGGVNRFYFGYGSKHDDSTFRISICDNCIDEKIQANIVTKIS